MTASARPVVIAHRTCPRHAPENSLEGMRTAADQGADLVEIDVRRARDGVPVLLHDPLLARTTNRPWPVWSLGSPALARVQLRRNGERLPRLADLLEALPPGLGVAIDIKDASAAAPTLAEVRRWGVSDRVLLWSRRRRAVRYLVRAAPDIEVALLRDTHRPRSTHRYLRDAVRCGAAAVSVHQSQLDAAMFAQARALGLRVYAWLRSPAIQAELLPDAVDAGLVGVITDWVPEAIALLDLEA